MSEWEDRRRFLLYMGHRLHSHGTPAHRLERELMRVATALDVQLQVLSTPTALIMSFGELADQQTHVLRTNQGDEDLGRLIDFDAVTERVVSGAISPSRAKDELDAIVAAPPKYGRVGTLLAFLVTSASAARFFGGGTAEVMVSGGVALLLAAIAIAQSSRHSAVGLFEPLAAFLAATIAGLAQLWAGVSADIVTLASLIVLIPGLTFTIGMTELATRHLVSGAARLAKSAVVFLSMAMGVLLSRRTTEALFQLGAEGTVSPTPASWSVWIALGFAPIGFAILFRLRVREWGWLYASGVTGFLVAREMSQLLGVELGTAVGALAVALLSNGYARITKRPSTVTLLPGILMLVPGSVGFRSLTFFLADDAVSGLESAFQMSLVAASLVGGLLAGNALLQPRREL